MKIVIVFLALAAAAYGAELPHLRIGSKTFTESYILAEILAQVVDSAGEAKAERKFGLGQTGIAFQAIQNGEIDLYPEYTGTIAETLLKKPGLGGGVEQIRTALRPLGLNSSLSLGFNNTYALAIRKDTAQRLNLRSISDLAKQPSLRAGFTHEFIEREDCYPKLRRVYGINLSNIQGLSHALAYEALGKNEIELIDVYSTDAKIEKLDLAVLADDKKAFPDYLAVILAREPVAKHFPKTWAALRKLEGRFSEKEMRQLNAEVEIEKKSFADAAHRFLRSGSTSSGEAESEFWNLTLQHLTLVGLSLLASILVGVPLAILANRYRGLGQLILMASGIVQTIPSLALLCFLIPLFGIGMRPALVALFLYGLLPIVRSTYVGLTSIDSKHREVAKALGLSPWVRLGFIELPLASPSLLAGIQTSAVISVGTATLAALIGAGGYGVPIVTGLALNDLPLILHGAIPAAVMALAVHGSFELLDRIVIPKGLRI